MTCPFCDVGDFERQLEESYDFFHERGVHLTKQQARLMAMLRAKDGIIRTDSLIAGMWYDCPQGEPESAENAIKVYLSKCRKAIKLAELPWRIRSIFGVGYVLEDSEGKALRRIGVSLALLLFSIYPLSNLIS